MSRNATILILLLFSYCLLFPTRLLAQTIEIDNLIRRGLSYAQESKIEDAIEIFLRSLSESRARNYESGVGYSLYYLGHFVFQSDVEKSLDYSKSALKAAFNIGDENLILLANQLIAKCHFYLGNIESSIQIHDEIIKIARKRNDIVLELNAQIEIASCENLLGNHGSCIDLLNDALFKAKSINNPSLELSILFKLGMYYNSLEDTESALSYFKRCLDGSKNLGDENFINEVKAQISSSYTKTGKYYEAEKLLNDCYIYYTKSNQNYKKAFCLASIGFIQYFQGNFQKSKETLDSLLEYFENSNIQLGSASIYLFMSTVYKDIAEFDKALKLLLAAKEIFEDRNVNATKCSISIGLGEIYYLLGSTEEANKHLNDSIKINASISSIAQRASNLFYLAELYRKFGFQSKALELLIETKKLYEESNNTFKLNGIHQYLAYFYLEQGDITKAYDYASRLIDRKEIISADKNAINKIILLKRLSYALGEKEKAKKSINIILDLCNKLDDDFLKITCYNEAADFYINEAEYYDSIRYLKKSELLIKNNFSERNALVYGKLAYCYYKLDIIPSAKSYIEKSISINSKFLDKKSLQWDYYLLGKIYKEMNNLETAITYFRKAESLLNFVVGSLEEKPYVTIYLESYGSIYEEIISVLHELYEKTKEKNIFEEALKYSDRSRAKSLLKNLKQKNILPHSEIFAQDEAKENLLFAELEQLENLFPRASSKKEGELILSKIVEIEEELNELNNNIIAKNPRDILVRELEYFNIEHLQKESLYGGDTAILEYFVGENGCFVFCVTDRDNVFLKLDITKSQLYEMVREMREPYDRIKSGSPVIIELEKYNWSLSSELYEDLVKPVVPHIKSIKNIIIIPHRVLNYINFESLYVKENDKNVTGNQYLINFYNISYLPSISVFQLLSYRDNKSSIIDKSLLLYANPNFERDERIEEKKGEINVGRGEKTQLQNLALSLKEANDIKKYFSSSKICTGIEATEDNFKSLAPNYEIVHVASHGILHDNPQFQGLAFSYNEKIQEVDILKTYEVYRLNLNCELITLSACETGISQKLENIGLDGVEGISRAFLYAGTKSLVVSLWQVADESTSILMSEFYKNYIQEEMSKSEALRQAKLTLMKMSKKVGQLDISYAHPFFWAPFILIGDPGYLNINYLTFS